MDVEQFFLRTEAKQQQTMATHRSRFQLPRVIASAALILVVSVPAFHDAADQHQRRLETPSPPSRGVSGLTLRRSGQERKAGDDGETEKTALDERAAKTDGVVGKREQ